MFYLTCFARVCKIFTALVLTAATKSIRVVCLVFRKLYILGATVEHNEQKKRCKVDVGRVLFQKFNCDVFVCLPVEITIVFPPAKHVLHNSVSLNAFAPKVRTSAVIVGHLL